MFFTMPSQSDQSGQCTSRSNLMPSLLSLAGGVGLGAGLLYLLDPDKGRERRTHLYDAARHFGGKIADSAGALASSVGEYAGSAYHSARDFAGEKLHAAGDALGGVSEGASRSLANARDAAYVKLGGESPLHRKIGVSICALSSMALGAALMYIFDPAMGRSRRRYVQEHAADYARKASDTLRHTYESAKDKVASMTGATQSPPPLPVTQSSYQSEAPMM